jgi:hypothetical protein
MRYILRKPKMQSKMHWGSNPSATRQQKIQCDLRSSSSRESYRATLAD